MGQIFTLAAGPAYLDVSPPATTTTTTTTTTLPTFAASEEESETTEVASPTENVHFTVEESECQLCKQRCSDHYICCRAGHGACWNCLMLRIEVGQFPPPCHVCNNHFLEMLIPNVAFNDAIRKASSREPPPPSPQSPPPPPPSTVLSRPISPRIRKRARTAEEIQASRRQRAAELSALGAQMADH